MSIIKRGDGSIYIDPGRVVSSTEFKKMMRVKSRLSRLLSLSIYPTIEQEVIASGRIRKTAERLWNQYEEIRQFYPEMKRFVADVVYLKRKLPILKSATIVSREYEILNLDRVLDEIKEMINLYNMQKKRIDIEHALEVRLNKLMPSLNKEIALALELLKTIAAMKDKVVGKYTLPSVADSVKGGGVFANIFVDNRQINLENTNIKNVKRVLDVIQMILNGEIEVGDVNSIDRADEVEVKGEVGVQSDSLGNGEGSKTSE
jgi:hypothetical protein